MQAANEMCKAKNNTLDSAFKHLKKLRIEIENY